MCNIDLLACPRRNIARGNPMLPAISSVFAGGVALHRLGPVAHIEAGVPPEAGRAGHEDGLEADTLVVEAAVGWVGHEHRVTIDVDTLGADHIGLLPGPGMGSTQGDQACERYEDLHCLRI